MKCDNCVLFIPESKFCKAYNKVTEKDCILYTIDRCKLCGQPILPETGIIPHDTIVLLCNNCGNALYTCGTCSKATQCALNSYNGPKPRAIQKTFRQGNSFIQTQVPNPELIKECCEPCSCFSNNECQKKNNNTCGNWSIKNG